MKLEDLFPYVANGNYQKKKYEQITIIFLVGLAVITIFLYSILMNGKNVNHPLTKVENLWPSPFQCSKNHKPPPPLKLLFFNTIENKKTNKNYRLTINLNLISKPEELQKP